MFDAAVGQLIALAMFFAFPAIEYVLLRRFCRREGMPQLWYVPSDGYRIVMRNLQGKRTLSNIRYRALVRSVKPASNEKISPIYVDDVLHERSDFFLFPGVDQILLSFTLEPEEGDLLWFVCRNLRGEEQFRKKLDDFDKIVCDYEATVQNLFNFDMKIAKRVEVDSNHLKEAWVHTHAKGREVRMDLSSVCNVA